MNAIVLCGGRGTRLDADVEKPLYEVGGRPTIDRVLDALAASEVDRVVAATSPHAPNTREHLARRWSAAPVDDASDDVGDGASRDTGGATSDDASHSTGDDAAAGDGQAAPVAVELVDTPGAGYVEDLETALDAVGRPAVTVAADLPLLAAEHVDEAVAAADDGARSLTVRVPASLKRLLGATCERDLHGVAPTGLNVVGPPDVAGGTLRTYDARLAVNVNTVGDARLAEALL